MRLFQHPKQQIRHTKIGYILEDLPYGIGYREGLKQDLNSI